MNAWLLTWTCNIVKVDERLVAILPLRRSQASVAQLMEFLVLRATNTAKSAAYYANRQNTLVHKAETPVRINDVPHGDRIMCGHDPWLYGRKVTDLNVDVDAKTNEEIVSWREPDDFSWTDGFKRNIKVSALGRHLSLRRDNRPLSVDIYPCRSEHAV